MDDWLLYRQNKHQCKEENDGSNGCQTNQSALLTGLVITDMVELTENERGNQAQQGQEEGQNGVPLTSGIMQRRIQNALGRGDGVLSCLLLLLGCILIQNSD